MKYLVTVGLLLGLAMPAMAWLGLPIADDGQTEPGLMRVSAGITLESDFNLYGTRFAYGVNDSLAVFGGIGIVDPDNTDSEPYFQLGGTYRLYQQMFPFDLAVRGAFGITSFEWSTRTALMSYELALDLWTLNVGALISKPLDRFSVYGLLGVSYQNQSFKVTEAGPGYRMSRSLSDNETYAAFAVGVLYPLNDRVSFYGELAHIDELFSSVGGRYRF